MNIRFSELYTNVVTSSIEIKQPTQ